MRIKPLITFSLIAVLTWAPLFVTMHGVSAKETKNEVVIRAAEHKAFDRIALDWHRKVPFKRHDNGLTTSFVFRSKAKAIYQKHDIDQLTHIHNFRTLVDPKGHLIISFQHDPKAIVSVILAPGAVLAIDITAEPTAIENVKSSSSQQPSGEVPSAVNQPSPVISSSSINGENPKGPPQPPNSDLAPSPLEEVPGKKINIVTNAPVDKPTDSGDITTQSPPLNLNPLPSSSDSVPPKVTPPPAAPKKEPHHENPKPIKEVKKDDRAPIPLAAPRSKVESQNLLGSGQSEKPPTSPNPLQEPQKLDGASPGQGEKPIPHTGDLKLDREPELVLSVDPHVPTRTAIFVRAGRAYLLFDHKLALSVEALTQGLPAPKVTPALLELPRNSGLSFIIPITGQLRVNHKGTLWELYLSEQNSDVPVSATLVAQPDFALGARYLLPLPDAPEPIHFRDPIVGDDLIIVPLIQNEAFSVPRKFSEFQIVPAAQGLVVKPLIDNLSMRTVADGIEITTEGGLRLSSSVDTGLSQQSPQKAKEAETGKSLFDFASWRGKSNQSFTETRQKLEQNVVDVPEAERNRARLELARFYFANGNGEEATALLSYLIKQVPDLQSHPDFLALLGASQIYAHHPVEGLQTLSFPALQHQPEIELWQAVAAASLRNWPEAQEKFQDSFNLLYGYPEPFRSKFSVLAIEASLSAGKDHEAADWLDKIEESSHSPDIDVALRYLRAVLHAKAGRSQAAEAAWKEVAASNDRLYKVRAEMALVDLGVATGSLTPLQAAKRLEPLRFAWRGDDLEVDILHRLGQYYVQAKDIKSGLSVLSEAVQLFPQSPYSAKIHEEMTVIFHNVFLGDLKTQLRPLDALTLYQQYRTLMPSGKDGDAVLKNLAERLVAVDLLDQAASLLDDLVKERLQGEERAQVGTRLAAIRLLDHKPEQALSALEVSNGEFLPADIQNDRILIRAKALSELHHEDEALALLQNNTRHSAKLLRADITMHAHQWDQAAKALLEVIGPPPPAGVPLTAYQADWLVNCAIAFAMNNDTAGLNRLAVEYGAAMAGSPANDTFRILVSPDKSTQLRDISAAQSRIADVDMFQSFLETYRKGSPPPATNPEKSH